MHIHFFPGPLFAWAFLGGLLAILAVAAFIDLRRMDRAIRNPFDILEGNPPKLN